jgi:predicted N-acetyltransferase YhbS
MTQTLIHAERPIDSGGIRYVLETAFGRRDEVDIVHRIRKTEGFIPSLSLVADSDGFIIGHAMFSEVMVYSGETAWEAVVLGPIAVMPDLQRQGVGGMLIRTGMQHCRELGYALVVLTGHPAYYTRFGFAPAMGIGLTCNIPISDEMFMAYAIRAIVEDRQSGARDTPKAVVVGKEKCAVVKKCGRGVNSVRRFQGWYGGS